MLPVGPAVKASYAMTESSVVSKNAESNVDLIYILFICFCIFRGVVLFFSTINAVIIIMLQLV